MKCICFSNQREINTWSSGDNTRHEKISQQTMLSPIYLKTLFILALSVLCPFSTTHRFLCGNVVLKLVQCVCECFLLCTVWSCWVQNIHHSFVGWTGIELSCPHLPFVIRTASASAPCRTGGSPQRPDGFPGKSALRPNAAALGGGRRPRRGCGVAAEQRRRGGRQGERWPGPQSAKRAPDIESRTWGVSILFFLEILRNMFAFSVNPKHVKNIEKCWDQWSHVRSDSRGIKGGSRARNQVSPTWGTSRIFLGWKFCVAALLAENWWSSYSLFDFLDDIAFERLFDLWTKTRIS